MSYVLINNNKVVSYPYSLTTFRAENPNVSLPENPTEAQLNEQGIYTVYKTDTPVYDLVKEKLTEDTPVFTDKWEQSWKIEPLTATEVETNINTRWAEVRKERDSILLKCDWTQLSDVPLIEEDKQKWAIYRQALRDVTNQQDPFNIVWPSEPVQGE